MVVSRRQVLIGSASFLVLLVGFGSVVGFGNLGPKDELDNSEWRSQVQNESPVKATFAGGCFWCTEAIFEGYPGVEAAISGYAEGNESTATYDQVKTGETNHREAVRVLYYPSIVSYEELLDRFWRSIDPTDDGGQFVDRGYQYTTAIYAHNEEQYRAALESKENLSESDRFDEPIVTEIKNFTTFFRAEDYHQNYSKKRSASYEVYKQASGRKNVLSRLWEDHPFK